MLLEFLIVVLMNDLRNDLYLEVCFFFELEVEDLVL